MPSTSPRSPSPAKRPPMAQRSSSASLLSSSGKPAGATKQHRPHLVSRHSRNVSQRHLANNMGKKAMSNVYGEGGGGGARHHRRNKSGNATPTASPNPTTSDGHLKRNSSHVVLPKNRSHGNLRKNQSTNTLTALNRNLSKGALNKLGAPAIQKAKKEAQQKQGVFDLGNASDEEEEEAEWEDSTASPELTRDNSKVSTPVRSHTPNGEPIQKPPDRGPEIVPPEKTSSPPEPTVMKTNRSAPNLRHDRSFNTARQQKDPALLQKYGRGSRAPPAMTTANAHSSQQNLNRNESQRSLKGSSRTSLEASQESGTTDQTAKTTPTTPGVGTQSSSGSAGISHFLTADPNLPRTPRDRTDSEEDDDDDSVSDFMATYKPQQSESPEKPRMNINKPRLPTVPSRTQQKLELQRWQMMRGNAPPPTAAGVALSAGSSVSLHSRTHSQSKGRSVIGEAKAIKQEYDTAVKQLTVVRRFRNPVLESLSRLKQAGAISSEHGSTTSVHLQKTNTEHKRPPSRHGKAATAPATGLDGHDSGTAKTTGTTPDDKVRGPAQAQTGPRPSKTTFASTTGAEQAHSRPNHTGRDSKVTFQFSRQDSHDDLLAASQGASSPGTGVDEDTSDGLSAEEALIRRMWESRIHVA